MFRVIIIIIIIIWFDVLSDSNISPPYSLLRCTTHSSINELLQAAMRTSNDVSYPQVVLRGRKIPGNSPKCSKQKRDNFSLVHFSRSALSDIGTSVFSPAKTSRCSYPKVGQRLSESIQDGSCEQVWHQGDFFPSLLLLLIFFHPSIIFLLFLLIPFVCIDSKFPL